MSRQITWGDSYNQVTGKQIGNGQEARSGTRETKIDGFSLFLREQPNLALTLQSRNGHAMKSGLKFYMNTVTALEIGLITLSGLLRYLYIKQHDNITMIYQSSPIYYNQ